jgi:hypothetical protein
VAAPNNSSPIFNAQVFGYAAGEQNTPQLPPRRDAPVAGTGLDVDPLFVEIAWGTSMGGVARLLAHWPMQGSSIVVTGSYVEVFAGTFLIDCVDGQLPVLQAAIAPDDGLAVSDSAELSLQQSPVVNVGEAAGDAAVLYVPDFARRVMVVLTDPTTGHVESTGHPRCWFDWFDDSGILCASWMQGSVIGVAPQYVPVPARATLLRIGTPGPSLACGEDLFTSQVAQVDWRIAP